MEEKFPVIGESNKQDAGFSRYFLGAFEFIKIIVIAILIVLPVRYFLFQPFIVKGESMVPTFQSGDYLIVDEISYRIKSPERGDVVVFKYPLDTTQRFIKRIIGLPGETVQIKNGKVWISQNGSEFEQLDESYLPGTITDGSTQVTLKENQYFVLGDNRFYSYDSRRWGTLPREDIVGKAALRLFPVSQFSVISDPAY